MSGGDEMPAVRVSFFGATSDTGNLGVSALFDSTLTGLSARIPGLDATVFDHAPGCGSAQIVRNGRTVEYRRCGARWSRRVYRRHTLDNIRVSARLGGLWNEAARRILRSHAVLDISGGDSFTDLYGEWRLRHVNLPKVIALENRIPLILLPQTYGPFRDAGAQAQAERIVRGAAMAWARDERSFEVLRGLLGSEFDADRHVSGVDVAFLLEAREPTGPDAERIAAWLRESGDGPVAGLNVSGLLSNREDRARKWFGLRADYGDALGRVLERLLRDAGARVLLVPHVLVAGDQRESDVDACEAVRGRLPEALARRCLVVPPKFDQNETKWLIGRCEWFCGTRMHATIAALSSGVPAVAVSYSPKTLGVFETCGQGRAVADPTALSTEEVTDLLWSSWESRARTREELRRAIPGVVARAASQMDRIAGFCLDRAGDGAGAAGATGARGGTSLRGRSPTGSR